MNARKRLLNIKEVQTMLNCSRATAYRLLKDPGAGLDALMIRGAVRVTSESLDAYIRRQIIEFQENLRP